MLFCPLITKKHLRMQVLFGLSAFRLSAGDIAAYGVLPLPHGGIRLSRGISDLRFGGRSARRPDRHCARIFAGLCTAVVILDCRREGLCTLSFIIINHKLRVTAGRLCLRVCAFAAVCGISSVRGFFIYRRAARISPEMRDLRRNHFFAVGTHLRTALPSSAEKFFPAGARCRARVLFRRIFRSEFRGENAFLEAPQNDTFCKFERKFIHFTQFFIDKRRCLPYN